MVDTVKLWKPFEMCNKGSVIDSITNKLDNATLHTNQDGTKYVSGYTLGMKTSVSLNGLSLTGSLCKSYLNDNFQTLTRQCTQRAIEQLSDIIHISLNGAKVSRVDIGQNFIVNEDPEKYYYFLGNSKHFARLEQPHSITYQQGLRTKLFYNKVEEAKSKKLLLPKIFENRHVLRYELRFMSRLPKQFNKAIVTAQDLYNEAFYIHMLQRWIDEYNMIQKHKLLTPKTDNMTSNEAFEYFFAYLIEIHGQNKALEHVEQIKDLLSNKREFERFKAKINNLKDLTQESDLIKELSTKINRVKNHFT
jgi:hypothetical protein